MKSSLVIVAAVFAVIFLAGSTVSVGATFGPGPAPQLGIQPIPPATPPAAQFAPIPSPVPAPPPAPAPPPVDPVSMLTHEQKDWYYQIRDLATSALSSNSMDEFRAGEQKVLAIKDPAALEPMALALYTSNTRWRSTFIQAVEKYAKSGVEPANKLAVVFLEDMAVKDSSGVLRSKARADLLAKDTPRETSRLKYQLANSLDSDVRDRAASLLAAMKDQTALANLVDGLTTEETRVNGFWVDSRSVQLDLRPAVSTLQSMLVVQEGATAGGFTGAGTGSGGSTVTAGSAIGNIMLPTVHITEAHTTVGVPGGMTITPDVTQVTVQHAEIRAALKSLTGQDFGYDKAAWMNWITSGHGDSKGNVPQPSTTWGTFNK